MRLAIIMAVAMLGDLLGDKGGVPRMFRRGEFQWIMGGGHGKRRERKSGGGCHDGQLPKHGP
jgi:hypothetical protein